MPIFHSSFRLRSKKRNFDGQVAIHNSQFTRAAGETRTLMPFRALDPKSSLYTNFSTAAFWVVNM